MPASRFLSPAPPATETGPASNEGRRDALTEALAVIRRLKHAAAPKKQRGGRSVSGPRRPVGN